MRAGPNHPVFDIHPDQYIQIQKSFGFHTQEEYENAIDILDTWARKQNHFTIKEFDRDYLEAYIVGAKGSMEKAKYRLDQRCTFRNMMPEMFTNIQVRTEFQTLFQYYSYSPMPVCTKDFYRVVINKLNAKIEQYDLLEIARYINANAEYNMFNEYIYGFESIMDLRDVSLAHILMKTNPMIMRKLFLMVQDGYGCRLKAIHLICDSKLVDNIVTILKQCMSEKLGNRIQVHSSYETLHKFIDKECLPSDYGGTGPSIREVHDRLYKELCKDEHVARMKEVEQYATDETKRLSGKFNEEYMGMPGSFRTLSVD